VDHLCCQWWTPSHIIHHAESHRLCTIQVFVPTPDGENIQCWLFKYHTSSKKVPTLLFFHGNAGNISHRLPNIQLMVDELKCNVLIMSYRGYGKSTGNPSEIGIKLDSMSTLAYLQNRKDINPRKIILFGRSLGGAVAADLAAHSPLTPQSPPLAAVILENTFTSISDMQQIMFPALSLFSFLCTNRWMTIQAIKKVRVPILFISGGADEVVPTWMMKKLNEVCSGPKVWKFIQEGEHMDTWTKPGYFPFVKKFIDDLFLLNK